MAVVGRACAGAPARRLLRASCNTFVLTYVPRGVHFGEKINTQEVRHDRNHSN